MNEYISISVRVKPDHNDLEEIASAVVLLVYGFPRYFSNDFLSFLITFHQ